MLYCSLFSRNCALITHFFCGIIQLGYDLCPFLFLSLVFNSCLSDSDVSLTPTVNSVPTSAVQPLDHEPPIVSAHSPSAASRARAPQHKQQQQRKVESADSHLPSTVQATHGSTSSKPTRDGGQGKKTAGGGGWGSVHQDDVDSGAAMGGGGGRNKQSWRSSRDQGQRDGGGGRGSGRNYSSGGNVNSGRGKLKCEMYHHYYNYCCYYHDSLCYYYYITY